MKTKLMMVVMALFVVLIGANAVAEETGWADPRVARLLQEKGIDYDVSRSGNYCLTFPSLVSNQVRRVWIESRTAQFSMLEIRNVWSVAYIAKGHISLDDAKNFLTRNYLIKMGAWQVVEDDGKYVVIFSAKVDADQTPTSFKEVIALVRVTADGVAKQIADGRLFQPGE